MSEFDFDLIMSSARVQRLDLGDNLRVNIGKYFGQVFWRSTCRLSCNHVSRKDKYIQEKEAYIFGKGWDGASQKGSGVSGRSGGKNRRKKKKEKKLRKRVRFGGGII